MFFFISPFAYIQTVGTIRMFTEDINYVIFTLIIHIPFLLYLLNTVLNVKKILCKKRSRLHQINDKVL